MIANCLTKPKEKHQGWLYIKMSFRWRITYDAEMNSEKKLKAAGLSCLLLSKHTPHVHTQRDLI
jgi:hypothetical protein